MMRVRITLSTAFIFLSIGACLASKSCPIIGREASEATAIIANVFSFFIVSISMVFRSLAYRYRIITIQLLCRYVVIFRMNFAKIHKKIVVSIRLTLFLVTLTLLVRRLPTSLYWFYAVLAGVSIAFGI